MSFYETENEVDYLSGIMFPDNDYNPPKEIFADHLDKLDTLITLGDDVSGYKSICERTLEHHFDADFIAMADLQKAVARVLTDSSTGLFIPAAFPKYSLIVTENNLNPMATVTLPIPDIVLVGKTPLQKQVLKVFSMEVHKPLIHTQFQHEPHAHLCASTAHALSSFINNGSETDAVITSRASYEEAKKLHDIHCWNILKTDKNGVFILLTRG